MSTGAAMVVGLHANSISSWGKVWVQAWVMVKSVNSGGVRGWPACKLHFILGLGLGKGWVQAWVVAKFVNRGSDGGWSACKLHFILGSGLGPGLGGGEVCQQWRRPLLACMQT